MDTPKIEAMTQAMACMNNTQKGPTEKISGTKPPDRKPYLRKKRPTKVTKGLDSIINPSLTCHYWKDIGHELKDCSKLQHRIRREQLAEDSIITKQALNRKHP